MRIKSLFVALVLAVLPLPAWADAPVLDNERVTINDIAPGDSATPDADKDVLVLFYAGGKVRVTGADGKTMTSSHPLGGAIFLKRGTATKIEPVSGKPHLIVIALKDHPQPLAVNTLHLPLAFPRPGVKKILENDRVVVWNYTWLPNRPTAMHFHDKDAIVVYRFDGSLKSTTPDGVGTVNDYTAGQIKYNKADRVHSELLVKNQQAAIITELK
jgi:hypothetical protein